MKSSLTVVQHHPAEGVGELGAWAGRNDIALDVHRADLGSLPEHVGGCCVLLGGPYAVNEPPDWLQAEKAWLRTRVALGVPLLGICLGSQLLAEALGGRIHTLDRPESGWTRIDFADGRHLDALQWHSDAFTLPPGGALLARSGACDAQMFRVGASLVGIQFHPEWNPGLVAALNAHFGEASPLPRIVDADRYIAVADWFHTLLDAWWHSAIGLPSI